MMLLVSIILVFLFAAIVDSMIEIRRLKRQVNLLTSTPSIPTLAERNKCGCGHHKSGHKPDGNMECQTATFVTAVNRYVNCPCVHFVSDAPDTDEINRIQQAMKETAEWLKD